MKTLRIALLMILALLAVSPDVRAATGSITAQGAIAPRITLTPGVNLDFGELAVQDTALAGYYEILANGTVTPSNATQIGATAGRGTMSITGRSGINVVLSVAATAFACDTSYLGSCSGTPTLTGLATSFTSPGQISNASCVGLRCTDLIYIGGRFNFGGTDEGRWTNTVTVTANYQ